MEIVFKVGDSMATFSRDWMTGKATLAVDGEVRQLQSPLNPMTHFGLQLTRSWVADVHQHKVVIEKSRPRIFAGFRPQAYRIFVEGNVVAEKTGY